MAAVAASTSVEDYAPAWDVAAEKKSTAEKLKVKNFLYVRPGDEKALVKANEKGSQTNNDHFHYVFQAHQSKKKED